MLPLYVWVLDQILHLWKPCHNQWKLDNELLTVSCKKTENYFTWVL